MTSSIIKSTHGKAVHLGEYKIHPHKIISEVSYKLVTIKLAEMQWQPKQVAFIIYNQKNPVKHPPMYKPLLVLYVVRVATKKNHP